MALFTRTTSQGKTITGHMSGGMLEVRIDGVVVATQVPGKLTRAQLAKVPTGFTHIAGSVPLKASEVTAFESALVTLPVDLRAERRDLVATVNGIADALDAHRAQVWDNEEITPLTSPELDAARAALAAFDAAHPEIKAALVAERNEWM